MKKRILAALVTLFIVAGTTVVIASPAQATGWGGPCHGAGVICFAEHTNGNGYHWGPRTLPYGGCVNMPSGIDNKSDSLWNKYGIDGTPPLALNTYETQGCNSLVFTWGPEAYVLNIGWLNRNRISSVCLGPRQQGYCR